MSELVSPRVRRNNLVTFILLVLFAIGLCAFVLISMRVHAQRRAANPDATGFIEFGVRRRVAALQSVPRAIPLEFRRVTRHIHT